MDDLTDVAVEPTKTAPLLLDPISGCVYSKVVEKTLTDPLKDRLKQAHTGSQKGGSEDDTGDSEEGFREELLLECN